MEETLRARKKLPRKKVYNLKRFANACFIYDYNPLLLLLSAANLDIQFIGEFTMALDKYITVYITKPERNATQKLWDKCNKRAS